eukprot:gb/GFBE01012310.1/.p1 GENE.gb/GFBE01012310.1/~~gb/GFBE01012310.1/.p1  ORF type:complete len:469 (+),score=42.00 gb/GFBE01012310.1/:1-1407(+)
MLPCAASQLHRLLLELLLLCGSVFSHRVLSPNFNQEQIWPLWQPSRCNMCLDTPMENLRDDAEHYAFGCVSEDSHSAVPLCDRDTSKSDLQAGGHVGTFYALQGGQVAKESLAFTRADTLKGIRHRDSAMTEWTFYMELWCLQRLRQKMDYKVPHVLDPFVGGEEPWAPRFYGLCRIGDVHGTSQHKLFLVMENLLEGYAKPSQLDLKLGITIEPESMDKQGVGKVMGLTIAEMLTPTGTDRARLAGYKVWSPHKQKYRTMWSKAISPLMSLDRVFDTFLAVPGRDKDADLLSYFGNRLEAMHLWWKAVGQDQVRSIAASLLFIYEGDTSITVAPRPKLKLIDFAHFFSSTFKPDWPMDGVEVGLASTMLRIDALAERGFETVPNRSHGILQICGTQVDCEQACPGNVNREGDGWSSFGIARSRCQQLASDLGYEYLSWRAKRNECHLCPSLVGLAKTKPWYVFRLSK